MTSVEEMEREGKQLIEQYQGIENDQNKIEQSVQALRSQILENQTVGEGEFG